MTKFKPYFPIITSNINSLNIPIKRHRMDGLKKQNIFLLSTGNSKLKNRKSYNGKMEKTLQSNETRKPAGMAGPISE